MALVSGKKQHFAPCFTSINPQSEGLAWRLREYQALRIGICQADTTRLLALQAPPERCLMEDFNLTDPTNSLVGKLLVASSIAADPVLARSVCLVVHQDEEHLVAVMLNRPMNPNPSALLKMLDQPPEPEPEDELGNPFEDDEDAESEASVNRIGHLASQLEQAAAEVAPTIGTVHFGGPLSGPVVAVHGLSEYAEAETGEGVYVAAQRELLENLVRQNPGPYRLIVGHLGWTLDQFSQEYQDGRWHVIDATSDAVLNNDAEMWPRLIGRATSKSVARWVGIADLPGAATLN